MKIAYVGLEGFSSGKKKLVDKRLTVLEGIIKPSKTTAVAFELLDSSGLLNADGIICNNDSKLDLIINDLEIVENWLSRVSAAEEQKLPLRCKEILEKNTCLCEESFSDDEKKILFNFNLVSIKPAFFVGHPEDKPQDEIIFDAYYGLGLICFFTGTKDKELRAWMIKKGATALEAAGAIHSDIQRGFIKAEVISYDDLVKEGSLHQAKQHMRLEDKGYVVRDGDSLTFRFSV